MSVIVKNLTKTYGTQQAVGDLSFEAKPGEILGFLGPNGAGKTTTMKMITCFIPPTSGEISVCGQDTQTESMDVRRQIGYLPEHNPLYKDMYIREYLHFVAGLHKVPRPNEAVDNMIERTGLTRERHKIIGSLSKGYRQRVGLAQALLHDPKVLILDEPTSGLDPNQLIEIRQLIQELGKAKTVIFSSHIMQEVQAICDRVIIINRGQLVANDTIDVLRQKIAPEIRIHVEFASPANLQRLQKIKSVKSVEALSDNHYTLISATDVDIRADIFLFAQQEKLILLEMRREAFDIENIFQKLTADTAI
jgi:ABC-2 type transport system ATP-binding protein